MEDAQVSINIVGDDAPVPALLLRSVASLLTIGSVAYKQKLHCHWLIDSVWSE